ncbi:DUF3301 domain-containing protein [Azoarcus sp. PA01]|nr:DUF3301 domain-containing protein [Azoarcus sp. PA01]
MSSFELAALILLCLLGWFWLDSIKVRELGIQAARSACRREGVQFLDETVSISALRLARDGDGRLRLRRVYDFEFSASGDDRQRGSVMLLGNEVTMLDIGPRRASELPLH